MDGRHCRIDGCERKYQEQGLCGMHLYRWKRHGDPLYERQKRTGPCSIEGCNEPHSAKGYCGKHYRRWKKHGDPHYVRTPRVSTGDTKKCAMCKEVKPHSAFFPIHRKGKRYDYYALQSYCEKCRNVARVTWGRRLRKAVIEAYGGKCACCGEAHEEFLSIDHINGNGSRHRKSLSKRGAKSATPFYLWLKRNGFPKDEYRCLCMNCNFARGYRGYCPHERERPS